MNSERGSVYIFQMGAERQEGPREAVGLSRPLLRGGCKETGRFK